MTTANMDGLMATAEKQLAEHREWLAAQIAEIPPEVLAIGEMLLLAHQARQIKLRVVKASTKTVTVVWEYPDELHAWLSSDRAPKALRDTLAGGHVVDPSKPASSWRRATPADEDA